jgi:hypothetical protein
MAELIEAALERFDARLVASGLEASSTSRPSAGDRATARHCRRARQHHRPHDQISRTRAHADDPRFFERGLAPHAGDRSGPGFRPSAAVYSRSSTAALRRQTVQRLGLAIARRVIGDHGGTITISDAEPRTVVDIALPMTTNCNEQLSIVDYQLCSQHSAFRIGSLHLTRIDN